MTMKHLHRDEICAAPYLSAAVPLVEEKLRELLLDDPTNPPLNFALGNFYLLNDRFDEAINSYKAILACNPDFAEVRCNLGITYEALGLFDDALNQLKQAVLAKAQLVVAHVHIGRICLELGQVDRAITSFETVIQLSPNHQEANLQLAELFKQRGDEEKTGLFYRQVLRLDPECIQAHCYFGEKNFLLGQVVLEQGRFDEAFQIWSQGYEHHARAYYANRNVVQIRQALIENFQKQQGLQAALGEFKKAIRENPQEKQAFHSLFSRFYFSLGLIPELWIPVDDLDAQIKRWKQSLEREGEHPYPHYRIGVIYTYQAKLIEGREEFTRCRDRLLPKKRPSLKLDQILRFLRVVEKIVARLSGSSSVYTSEVRSWEDAGFSNPFEIENWKKLGIAPDEALLWKAGDISPEKARGWRQNKISPLQAVEWIKHGFEVPKEVRKWIITGLSPESARQWALCFSGRMELALQCYAAGLREPEIARKWMQIFSLPWEASRWQELGFSPNQAEHWIAQGVTDPRFVPKREG